MENGFAFLHQTEHSGGKLKISGLNLTGFQSYSSGFVIPAASVSVSTNRNNTSEWGHSLGHKVNKILRRSDRLLARGFNPWF